MRSILVLSANPTQTRRLRLDEEVRNIKEALKLANQRDNFKLEDEWAVTPRALLRALQEYKPAIVHFSGHGLAEGLILQDESGEPKIVSTEAISKTFEILADSGIECVILNACYSEAQATEIVKHIPYVIGMTEPIGDQAAIMFAESFYDALGRGQDYDKAFELGRNRLALESSTYQHVVKLKVQRKSNKVPRVWLQGWYEYRPENSDTADEIRDWTSHYSKDPWKIPTSEMWEQKLLPDLKDFKQVLTDKYAGREIDIRSTFSLSAALAVGYMFPEPTQYVLQIKQRQELWRTNAQPASKKLVIKYQDGSKGKNLLAGIAITSSGEDALKAFRQQSEQPFDSIVYMEPESGTGSRVLKSDAEAVAYAMDAKDLLRQYTDAQTTIHLVLFTPAAFALFLGHYSSRLGNVIPYEWDGSTYHPAFQLEAI